MPRFSPSFVIRVWVETEVVAPTRELAEEKAKRKAEKLLNENGFSWIDGKVELCGSTNLSLLNKLPE